MQYLKDQGVYVPTTFDDHQCINSDFIAEDGGPVVRMSSCILYDVCISLILRKSLI
jgi:hypothetical protein